VPVSCGQAVKSFVHMPSGLFFYSTVHFSILQPLPRARGETLSLSRRGRREAGNFLNRSFQAQKVASKAQKRDLFP
jgi:hypothetical protein